MTTSCNACVNILGWGGGQIVLKNPVREREEEEGWGWEEGEREGKREKEGKSDISDQPHQKHCK